ncbi:MAG: adenosine deaminase [Anaerolineae bacterium]|nr:adenosine deaminase [Anaerolineae bacterium]
MTDFIKDMPKVELHVHLQGATQPETWLELAERNEVKLPADTIEGMRDWFVFKDFPHFIQIYMAVCGTIRTAADVEFMARRFLAGQAEQNIQYTEITYTPHLHYKIAGLDARTQLDALNKARKWAKDTHDIDSGFILDISRNVTPEEGLWTTNMAIMGMNEGVVALGLGGPEVGHPPEKHAISFQKAHAAGLACILHAGETEGPASIWGAIKQGTVRIGHGVRCIEDPKLMAYLREKQIPLEVCPTSNVCLKVFPTMEQHPLPKLIAEGLYVTLNSDDPPMFNTSLTNEYLTAARVFGMDVDVLTGLVINGVRASRLSDAQKSEMEAKFKREFDRLEPETNTSAI